MADAPQAIAAAARLCAGAGFAAPVSLKKLAGGKNNRVYEVRLADGGRLVLKHYHVDPRDPRDRLSNEWNFLTYVWQRGVRVVPQPIAQEAASHCALYTFVSGGKLAAQDVLQNHIAQAARFILAANGGPRALETLAAGSEACFSLADHITTVDRRIARLDVLDETAPHVERARALVRDALVPAWQRVRRQITASVSMDGGLSMAEQCVSPSDFGFHNALVDDAGKMTFIDFEYAGRDDPAKLACDFFCCPEIPVPLKFWDDFLQQIGDGLGLGPSFRQRSDLLINAYRIKWACIILNDFLPLGAARRDFADAGQYEMRCAVQIDKALLKLSEIN